jgi:hypothetical protein
MYIAFLALGDGGVHLEGGETKTSFAYSKLFFFIPLLLVWLLPLFFFLSCILAKSLHDEMIEEGNRREKTDWGGLKSKKNEWNDRMNARMP